MTCPLLVRRSPAPAEVLGSLRSASGSVHRTAARWLRTLSHGDATAAQLTRFALTGGLSTAVQVLLFTLLAPASALIANMVAWAASTALANELHRRRTFRAGARVGWLDAQWEGGGLALLGLGVTSGALALLAVTVPGAGVAAQALLVLGVNAAVGGMRFLALRWAFLLRPQHA